MMCLDSAFAKNAIVHFRELKKCLLFVYCHFFCWKNLQIAEGIFV